MRHWPLSLEVQSLQSTRSPEYADFIAPDAISVDSVLKLTVIGFCIRSSVTLSTVPQTLTSRIIRCAIDVHRALGPGLLESAYQCLAFEIRTSGLLIDVQTPVPITYKGERIDCGYRLDIVVDRTVIVEVKAVDALAPIHEAQLLTYLKLTGLPLGLLFNFNVPVLKKGIRRLINSK
jgi:GxxExxY protein